MNIKVATGMALIAVCMVWVAGCSNNGGAKTTGEKSIYALAENGDAGAVRTALKNGYKVNTPDAQGMTILHHAAQGNQAELVEYLVERCGAFPQLKDSKGRTALDVAKEAGSNEAAQQLMQVTKEQ